MKLNRPSKLPQGQSQLFRLGYRRRYGYGRYRLSKGQTLWNHLRLQIGLLLGQGEEAVKSKENPDRPVTQETGEIEPTDGRGRRRKAEQVAAAAKPGPVPANHTSRLFYGATCLFDSIGAKLGITEDLKRCIPGTYKQNLSVAYYLILGDKNPTYSAYGVGLQAAPAV